MPDTNLAFIAAASGTHVVDLDDAGNVLRTPVIAWAPDAENPYRAPRPITLNGLARMKPGRAVEFPDGMVHDPHFPICFGSAEEWAVVAEKGVPEKKASTPPTPAPKAGAAPKEGGLVIEWSTSPFKTNSFYRYNDGDLDFIFQVDPGINPPKQKGAVTKIKRDEFMSLKKTVDVAEIEALLEGKAPGMDEIGDYDLNEDPDNLVGAADYEDEDGLI